MTRTVLPCKAATPSVMTEPVRREKPTIMTEKAQHRLQCYALERRQSLKPLQHILSTIKLEVTAPPALAALPNLQNAL